MKKSKYSEQQVIALLKEVELVAKVNETCRKYGISDATYYKWKSAYGGMDASQLRQLRVLQAENAKLKKMYAELAVVHNVLQDVVAKKTVAPVKKVELIQSLTEEHGLTGRQACKAVRLPRSLLYYRPKVKDDSPVIEAVTAYMAKNPRHGFGLLASSFKIEQRLWDKTVLWRVYCELNLPHRAKKRLPERIKEPLEAPCLPNETWPADFMADSLWSGRRFRTFNVLDGFNRQALRNNHERPHELLGKLPPVRFAMAKLPQPLL